MFKRIDTVFLQVTDFGEAIEWYSSVLGFSVRWRDDQGGYAAMEVGETPLTLVRSELVIPSAHIPFNFYVSDIEEAHRHLKELKSEPGQIEDDGTVKWFEFKDPDGNKLGVCHFKDKEKAAFIWAALTVINKNPSQALDGGSLHRAESVRSGSAEGL